MTAASGINSGSRILAAAIRGVAPLAAYKGADQSVSNNNSAWVADTDLSISLAANSRYFIIAMLAFSAAGSNVGDLITTFSWPAGSSGIMSGFGVLASATATPAGAGNALIGSIVTTPGTAGAAPSAYQVFGGKGTGAGQLAPAYMMCSVQTSSTTGNLQLLWCQHVASSASPTVMKAGSVLAAWQTQ